MLCSPIGGPVKIAAIRSNALVQSFLQPDGRPGAALPFTPDHIVYCRTAPLEADYGGDAGRFLEGLPRLLEEYAKRHGGEPRVLLVRGLGMIGVDESKRSVETCLDVFEERLKIGVLSHAFGGPAFLGREAIRFIETWEVESYRRAVSTGGRAGAWTGRSRSSPVRRRGSAGASPRACSPRARTW